MYDVKFLKDISHNFSDDFVFLCTTDDPKNPYIYVSHNFALFKVGMADQNGPKWWIVPNPLYPGTNTLAQSGVDLDIALACANFYPIQGLPPTLDQVVKALVQISPAAASPSPVAPLPAPIPTVAPNFHLVKDMSLGEMRMQFLGVVSNRWLKVDFANHYKCENCIYDYIVVVRGTGASHSWLFAADLHGDHDHRKSNSCPEIKFPKIAEYFGFTHLNGTPTGIVMPKPKQLAAPAPKTIQNPWYYNPISFPSGLRGLKITEPAKACGPAKCTKCGEPNEYQDGPFLCYRCKKHAEMFG